MIIINITTVIAEMMIVTAIAEMIQDVVADEVFSVGKRMKYKRVK